MEDFEANQLSWVQAFNFTHDQAKAWMKNLSQGASVVRWAIESGKIPSEMFLLWAKKTYQLPVLKTDFADFQTVNEIRLRYSNIWPDHVVPIGEWDGTLFLACLEPISGFKAPQHHQWVLASLEMIRSLRGEEAATHSASPSASSPAVAEAPAGLNLNSTASVSFSGLAVSTDTTASPPPIAAPEGISLAGITPESKPTPNSTEKTIDAPAGLNFGSITPPTTAPAAETKILDVPVGINFNLSAPPPPPPPAAPVAEAKTQPAGLHIVPPPIPTQGHVTPPPIPKAQPVAPPPIPPPPTGPTGISIGESGITSFEGVGAFALSELNKWFTHSMVLLFHNDVLQAWVKTPNWTQDASRASTIDLSTPSIFRVVSESKNSYHGYIVPNPVNDAFFATWNKSRYPEHITISPILIGDSLSGMILGITTKTAAASVKLSEVENLGEKLGQLLLKYKPVRAA